jgi:uncharacterized protein
MERSLTAADSTDLPIGRCGACGLAVFPASVASCPRCLNPTMLAQSLPGDGVIWSHTVQRFPPKSPPYVVPASGFEPFVVAYVEIAEGIRVEAILDTAAPDAVTIGQRVRLISADDVPRFVPLSVDPGHYDDGTSP